MIAVIIVIVAEAQKVWTFRMATSNAQKLSGRKRKSFLRQKKTRKSFSRQKSVRKLFLQQKSVLKSFLQQKSVR